ncbi:hypothetical protein K505DRAFT_344476 [Melanomma pulvis-pyrius CBS 109.77]|uniref:Uncharacterized protein n=1 Tax=Melanomma pulvis-pyrius CBS 109.77 TaxID=1314802 RepID=A0A6A6WP21_9PLEO|nr:hypothetical protein K505DRAFT_344476 [Melanomma pulvis-pyrius CBS 109.77]
MLPMDDDFNSSDVDFGPEPAGRFDDAGAASIKGILESAFADRLRSKKGTKHLQKTYASPKTEYQATLWINRFTAFREHTLRVSPDECPTCQHIERFFNSVVSHVGVKGGLAPSYKSFVCALSSFAGQLISTYKDFHLSPHKSGRINSVFLQLLADGKLTKDRKREKLDGARRNDNQGLDRHRFNEKRQKQESSKLGIVYYVTCHVLTLPNRGNNLHNRKIILKALPTTQHPMICPIKLLLVLALRFGNVDALSITELLARLLRQKKKTIVWRYPERPVLCGFHGEQSVMIDEPAPTPQFSATVSRAGNLIGCLTRLRPHDIRRGTAFDVANLMSSEIVGVETAVVRAALGHSERKRGESDKYIGGHQTDFWSARVREKPVNELEVDRTDEPPPKKKKYTPAAVRNGRWKNREMDSGLVPLPQPEIASGEDLATTPSHTTIDVIDPRLTNTEAIINQMNTTNAETDEEPLETDFTLDALQSPPNMAKILHP